MNKKIKIVWMLTIFSCFLLIVLQGYWLYNSISYSMTEAEKTYKAKVDMAVPNYLNQVANRVRNRSHIGYVMTAYFKDYDAPLTAVCSPENTDTIIDGQMVRKPEFRDVREVRDTFNLREVKMNDSRDCLNVYITYLMKKFDAQHFQESMKAELGNDFEEAQLITNKRRLWVTKIVEPISLFHQEITVEVPFNPIKYQSVLVKMRVPMQPILKGLFWQIVVSIFITIMLLLSFAYLIKVMLLQKKVEKMRSDFVHTMIHELKRPVQTLKMCVSVFSHQKEKTLDGDESQMILETVREESDNLTAYLSKLREVIRAEEHIPLQISSFDIHSSLMHLATVFMKNKQKEVIITLDYQRSSQKMQGDRSQLENVISNLIENSIKYSGDMVHIHVCCHDTADGKVAISVSDDGIGISQEEQSRVWSKFYRSNAFPGMMLPGIGLGLSFVDMVVRAHGGTKQLESEVGKGTKITIILPQSK